MAGAKRAAEEYESDNGFVEDDDDNAPPKNKKARNKAGSTAAAAAAAATSNKDDEKTSDIFFELGNKSKRITINSFHGKTLVHIREYYEDKKSGEMRPGKKGIALTIESYRALLGHVSEINEALRGMGEVVDDGLGEGREEVPVKREGNKEKSRDARANIEATDSEDE